MLKWARLVEPQSGCCAGSCQHVYLGCPSEGQARCSNESEPIHHSRSKYEVSHVIRTWQKVNESCAGLTNDCLLGRSAASPTGQWLVPRHWQIDRQQKVWETMLGDREHTDRWDSGSSQASQRWRGVMRNMKRQMGRGTSAVGGTQAELKKRK